MAKLSIFGVLTNIQILFFTMLHGKSVGTDEYGNRYYTGKSRNTRQKERRWVVYKGAPEASTVPAEWHGWLHHQTDNLPEANAKYRQSWQKPHLPNQTGSNQAYLPPGAKGHRQSVSSDYVAWTPPQ